MARPDRGAAEPRKFPLVGLGASAGAVPLSLEEAQALIQDLGFHKAELEKQNGELQRVQADLLVSRQRYFELFDLAPVGYLTLAADGTVLETNLTASRLLGIDPVEFVGQPLGHFVDPGHRDQEYLSRNRLMASGMPEELELRLVPRGLPPFWARLIANRVEEAGTVKCRMALADISDRKRAEGALHEEKELLALTLDGIGDGVVTLDAAGRVRTLNPSAEALTGWTLARDVGHPDVVTLKYLEKALAVFHRAKALTLQLLTFSSGGSPLRTHGRLGDLILKTSEFALVGSNVSVEILVPEDLWGCEFDEHQIEQVLDNLVINARQAMPQGGMVRVEARNIVLEGGQYPVLAQGPYLSVTVADQGEGIPAAVRAKIFDPFFTTKPDGHGLGLATCHSIVQKHGGLLELASEPGKGAVFRFFLPALKDRESSACLDPLVGHSGSGSILILDDEEYLREVLGTQLSCLGYQVLEAADGASALTLAAACGDLKAALLDLTIQGGLGGRETLAELKKLRPGLPVIATSGYSEDPVMASPRDFGFTASLTKPYQPADLARLLTEILTASSDTP